MADFSSSSSDEEDDWQPASRPKPAPVETSFSPVEEKRAPKKKKKKRKSVAQSQSYNRERNSEKTTQLENIDADASVMFSHHDSDSLTTALVFVMAALGSADLAMVLPSLSGFVSDVLNLPRFYYGSIACVFQIGQLFAGPLMSYWTDKRTVKEVLVVCAFLGAGGNVLYFLANNNPVLLLLGRFVAGLGSVFVFCGYAHIARTSHPNSKDRNLTAFTWLVHITQVIAPAAGFLGVEFGTFNLGSFTIQSYTFPAFLMAFLYTLIFLVILVHFAMTPKFDSSAVEFGFRFTDTDLALGSGKGQTYFFTRSGFVLLAIYFSAIFSYWCFIVSSFKFTNSYLNWPETGEFLFFMFIGGMFCVSFGILQLILRCRVQERVLIAPCLVLTCLGGIVLLPLELEDSTTEWQLYVSAALITFGFTFNSVLLPKLFALLSGTEWDHITTSMSWFFCFTCIASAAGPMTGALIAKGGANDMAIIGQVTSGVCLASMMVLVAFPTRGVHALVSSKKNRKDSGDNLALTQM